MPGKSISRYLPIFSYFLFILFIASIVCSWNAVSSISIGMLLVSGIVSNKIRTGNLFRGDVLTFFSTGCLLLYILQFAALLYTDNTGEGLKHIQLKSALVFVPFSLYFNSSANHTFFEKLIRWFIAVLVIATLFCLVMSFSTYLKLHDASVFFYHKLVLSIEQHAIQFSILVFVALILILEEAQKKNYFFHIVIHFGIALYLMAFLILLSSKLVIAFFLVYLVYYFLVSLRKFRENRFVLPISILACLIIASLLIFTRNPVSSRFNEIIAGKIQVVAEDKFNPGVYFNGLQFRLLQWKFVIQILNAENAWLAGVGPGDAQQMLDKKYIAANMYVGEQSTGEKGFLGYNTHNQFLECLLQTGIPGLICFLLVCLGMIKMAYRLKKKELSAVVLLLLAYALNESVFETQYGAMIFLFFPLFVYQGLAKYH